MLTRKLKRKISPLALGLGVGLGLATAAAPTAAEARPMPKAQQSGDGIRFVTGGVGKKAEKAIRKMAGQFNVHLTLVEPDGAYLSGMKVAIHDVQGNEVLKAEAKGPMFYAELDPGEYRVHVSDPERDDFLRNIYVRREQAVSLVVPMEKNDAS